MAPATLCTGAPPTRLLIYFASFAAAVEVSPGKQGPFRQSPLSLKDTDAILISIEKAWNEAHTQFARRIGKTVTTWRVPHSLLHFLVFRNNKRGRKSVLIGADPRTPLEDIPKLMNATDLTETCVSWLFVRPHSEVAQSETMSWKGLLECQSVTVVTLNTTTAGKSLGPAKPSGALNHRSSRVFIEGSEAYRALPRRLSGQKLTVACAKGRFYGHNKGTCYHPLAWYFFRLLKNCNVSVDFVNVPSLREMVYGTISRKLDIAYILALMNDHEVFFFDFPLTVIDHETFFSRTNAHRTVTLSEVGWESWRLAVATLTLLALVAVTQVLVTEGLRPTIRSTTGTVTFLLAAVLATSASEPIAGTRRRTFIRRALFGLWFLSILPLSAYMRSELTSIVTLRRPAERIDTLEELEDALDKGEMAPCTYVNTAAHDQLTDNDPDIPQSSLMRKLRAAFKRHAPEQLSMFTYPECLACALRQDRVCLSVLEQPCDLREAIPEVREFSQHFKIIVSGLRVRKSLPAYRPLRRFFLAIREGKLVAPIDAKCRYKDAAGTFELDLNSLFIQHIVLLMVSSVVLVVEILVVKWSLLKQRLRVA